MLAKLYAPANVMIVAGNMKITKPIYIRQYKNIPREILCFNQSKNGPIVVLMLLQKTMIKVKKTPQISLYIGILTIAIIIAPNKKNVVKLHPENNPLGTIDSSLIKSSYSIS